MMMLARAQIDTTELNSTELAYFTWMNETCLLRVAANNWISMK